MQSVTKKAYGKVNLFLSVGGIRDDGKHEVITVMCRVGIFDTVTVEKDSVISLECDEKSLPVNEDNIAVRAAMRYFETAKKDGGAHIKIEKRIPVTAGMGGGSSDAAAVLTALNELYGFLGSDDLVLIGAELGADVPFFLYDEPVMTGCGSGAEMSEGSELPFELYGCFVRPFEKISTGKAYAELDLIKGDAKAPKSPKGLLSAIRKKDLTVFLGAIENDFEAIYPGFDDVKKSLEENGAKKVFLCGSGPTVCALYTSEEAALKQGNGFVARIG